MWAGQVWASQAEMSMAFSGYHKEYGILRENGRCCWEGYGRRAEYQLEECCGTLYFSRIAATWPACMLVRKCDLDPMYPFLLSVGKPALTPRVWQKGCHVNAKAMSQKFQAPPFSLLGHFLSEPHHCALQRPKLTWEAMHRCSGNHPAEELNDGQHPSLDLLVKMTLDTSNCWVTRSTPSRLLR